MSGNFKINYLTELGEIFTLNVPNAFEYDEEDSTHTAKVNQAANQILSANAIFTDCGDLVSVSSIEYHDEVASEYNV